jgi:hypothetical protein
MPLSGERPSELLHIAMNHIQQEVQIAFRLGECISANSYQISLRDWVHRNFL